MQMHHDDPAIQWLLQSVDPSIRYLTLTRLLNEPAGSHRAVRLKHQISNGPLVRALLHGQRRDGGFGVHPYQKWRGAHWRLISLVELGIPEGHQQACAAANQVLEWLTSEKHRKSISKVNGLTRRCASQEGNALAVCSRLGMADDDRVRLIAESLIQWQWPDGGWNCDKDEDAHHSSFYESLAPMWGLIEYSRATDDGNALKSALRAAELFLKHRLFRSENTGDVINPQWLRLHYPLYYRYDILQALRIIALAGKISDKRASEALSIVEGKRLQDGRWRPEGYYWLPPGKKGSNVEVVNWGRRGPNEMITLNALDVLKAARRIN